ncbi:MAG: hypothetical protein ACTSRW_09265 [Candidatus Helarchaeota archaeon]
MRKENKLWFLIFVFFGSLAFSLFFLLKIPFMISPAFYRNYCLLSWAVVFLLAIQYFVIYLYKTFTSKFFPDPRFFFKRGELETTIKRFLHKTVVYNFSLCIFYLFFAIGFMLYFVKSIYGIDVQGWESKFPWLGIVVMTFSFEYAKILRTRYVFTIIDVILTAFIFLLPNFTDIFPLSALFFYPVLTLSIFFLPSTYFILAYREKEAIRVHGLFFGLGLFFLLSSVIIMRPALIESNLGIIIIWFETTFQFPYDIFTLSMIIFGYGLMAGFGSINFFEELHWMDKMMGIFVYLNNSGIPIFTHQFKETGYSEESLDETLVAAGFSGIVTIIDEITRNSERLKVIEQKDHRILIEIGNQVTAFLVVKEDLSILKIKMEDFLKDFENLFQESIQVWRGKVDQFEVADFLVQKHFGTESRII